MSCKILGSVKYKAINEVNDGIVKTVAIWTIPDFMKIVVEDKSITDLQSLPQKFMFRMYFERTKQRIRVSYRSQTEQIYLKSVELKTLTFDENQSESKEEASIARQERQTVLARKWYTLTYLDLDEFKGLCVQNNKKEIVWFVANGSLCLSFELVIITIKTKTDNWNIPLTRLNDFYKNIFLEGTYSDVVMKSSDGHEFKVHKVLLAGHSPVLKANFDHNFTESATNIVESPLESAVLHEMLSFMYTDQAKVEEMPEKLLAAADYYQLRRLKSLCEKALYEQLNVNNAVEILQLADLHSTEVLTKLTLDFIKNNYERLISITKTEGWAKLNSIDLIKRIFE